ncbi:hypothetical protein PHLCEN_2v9676 [Hermanssonia centrifuga]|uniref:Uncharacterized protein n=1 Tax=Hermanssonia centrifuga TaxID=98765 RepID=A0A2R6NQ36_9APHY|nr:hypothetical protein PHLCEN_2v9676 [Hermanssonia centrifuga]
MDADTFSAEVERALRRVRSTSDLDDLHIPSRPTRHPRGMQRRSESQWSQRATTYQARHARGVDPTDVRRAFPQIERPQEAAIRLGRTPHPSEAWDINFRFPEEPRQSDAGTPANNTRPPPRGWVGKVMVFFGQAGPDARVRSQLISVVWSLSFGLAQVRAYTLSDRIRLLIGSFTSSSLLWRCWLTLPIARARLCRASLNGMRVKDPLGRGMPFGSDVSYLAVCSHTGPGVENEQFV